MISKDRLISLKTTQKCLPAPVGNAGNILRFGLNFSSKPHGKFARMSSIVASAGVAPLVRQSFSSNNFDSPKPVVRDRDAQAWVYPISTLLASAQTSLVTNLFSVALVLTSSTSPLCCLCAATLSKQSPPCLVPAKASFCIIYFAIATLPSQRAQLV